MQRLAEYETALYHAKYLQIGLIDLLVEAGVKPDGIIGHSIGELACSYADGCMTLQQTIQAAYVRAKTVLEANLPAGAMAAIGLL